MGQDTCAEDGCDAAVRAKGRCKRHYSAWYRAQNPEQVKRHRDAKRAKAAEYNAKRRKNTELRLSDRTCEECEDTFNARTGTQRFCSVECRRLAERRRAKERGYKSPRETFKCKNCGCEAERDRKAPGTTGIKVYCSQACHSEAKRFGRRTNTSSVVPWSDCSSCGQSFVKRGRSNRCRSCAGRQAVRIAVVYSKVCACPGCGVRYETPQPHQKTCSKKCADRRSRITFRERNGRYDTHRKRAKHYGCEYEPVSRKKVFERDNYTCQICGESTSEKYSFNDPWSPTIDHIIPMSKQGSHTYENVQCAHAFCNSVKNDGRSGEDAATMLGADLALGLR